ncbi:MAG: hypothetical protein LBQ46_03970 [Treponema sp.]|jgi:hypothetical protein|nr:hypothetical protein [Treponema sp.]
MREEGARRLELLNPLFYIPAPELDPFPCGEGFLKSGRRGEGGPAGGERLFRFGINGAQGQSIEPDPALFLGPLEAAGYAAPPPSPGGMELPPGRYLFAQERTLLGRSAVILAAIEMQKDGLWERLSLEGILYLRYLFEDGGEVTQLFRPYSL